MTCVLNHAFCTARIFWIHVDLHLDDSTLAKFIASVYEPSFAFMDVHMRRFDLPSSYIGDNKPIKSELLKIAHCSILPKKYSLFKSIIYD